MENIDEVIQDMAFQLGVECEEDGANWQIIKWYLEMAYDEGLASMVSCLRNINICVKEKQNELCR